MSGSDKGRGKPDLARAKDIDFTNVPLGYEDFRQLSQNPNLTPEEKIAFPIRYRRGHEEAIVDDITRKLPALTERNRSVVDIGCGVGGVTDRIIALCAKQGHTLALVDSPEMLELCPDSSSVIKVPGMFPANVDAIRAAAPNGADAILTYSVLHYAFVDTNLFRFADEIISLLRPGGAALFGDIPNASKRRRFFSSPNGIAYHRAFMNTDDEPKVQHFQIEYDAIDDSVLAGLVARAQAAGCHAYVVPQDSRLPMANRRDDLIIQRP